MRVNEIYISLYNITKSLERNLKKREGIEEFQKLVNSSQNWKILKDHFLNNKNSRVLNVEFEPENEELVFIPDLEEKALSI